MTRQQPFKRRVRGRMAKTRESYTTARRQLLARTGGLFEGLAADEPLQRKASTPASSADALRQQLLDRRRAWVQETTGRAMDAWIAILDQAGARELPPQPHLAVARRRRPRGEGRPARSDRDYVRAADRAAGMGQSC